MNTGKFAGIFNAKNRDWNRFQVTVKIGLNDLLTENQLYLEY